MLCSRLRSYNGLWQFSQRNLTQWWRLCCFAWCHRACLETAQNVLYLGSRVQVQAISLQITGRWNRTVLHNSSHAFCDVSLEAKPFGDSPSSGVWFLPLSFILHEFLLHRLHRALLVLFFLLWKDIWKLKPLLLTLCGKQKFLQVYVQITRK